jgi:hypothetical protein
MSQTQPKCSDVPGQSAMKTQKMQSVKCSEVQKMQSKICGNAGGVSQECKRQGTLINNAVDTTQTKLTQ